MMLFYYFVLPNQKKVVPLRLILERVSGNHKIIAYTLSVNHK